MKNEELTIENAELKRLQIEKDNKITAQQAEIQNLSDALKQCEIIIKNDNLKLQLEGRQSDY